MTEIWDSLRCYWVEKDKLLAGSLPGRSTDVSALDQMTLLQQMGIRKIIDLTHPSETNGSLYLPALQSLNENTEHGIGYANVPIVDMGRPTITQMHDILGHIAETNKAGTRRIRPLFRRVGTDRYGCGMLSHSTGYGSRGCITAHPRVAEGSRTVQFPVA